MIHQEVLNEARKQIGILLRNLRIERNIKMSEMSDATGLTEKQITVIEENQDNYSIDDFLRIVQALDMYFFLSEKEGEHLNFEHMLKKSDPGEAAV